LKQKNIKQTEENKKLFKYDCSNIMLSSAIKVLEIETLFFEKKKIDINELLELYNLVDEKVKEIDNKILSIKQKIEG